MAGAGAWWETKPRETKDLSAGNEQEGLVDYMWITGIEADDAAWQQDVDDEYYDETETAGQAQT